MILYGSCLAQADAGVAAEAKEQKGSGAKLEGGGKLRGSRVREQRC